MTLVGSCCRFDGFPYVPPPMSGWQGWLDSNQRVRESKSLALPLGYTPIWQGRLGIEPTHAVLETASPALEHSPL